MGIFSVWGSKRDRKRAILEENRQRGRFHEDMYVMSERMKGNKVKRTGKGHDYKVTEPANILTGSGSRTYYAEVKSSSNAPVSKLQQRNKKQMKGRYRVVRPTLW